MKRMYLKGIGKWSIIASIAMLVLISSVLFSASPNFVKEKMVDNKSFENQDLAPRTQAITEDDEFTGIGQSLSSVEYANSTNASQSISQFDNISYGLSLINLPPQWTEYALFTSVTHLSDNKSWEINGNVDALSPWSYAGQAPGGQASGSFVNNVPLNPAGQKALYLHNAYSPGGSCASTDYVSFSETTYVNRTSISSVQFSFAYWVNSSMYGLAQLFTQIGGYTRYFPAFESDAANKTWVYQSFELTPQDISTYINPPQNIVIKLGINVTMNAGITSRDGYVFQDIYLDNISLRMRGEAKPSQVQLKCNSKTVNDLNYGSGNVTIAETWFNPSTTDFQAIKGNFTGNSTGMKLTTDLTIFANRTKQAQTSQDPDTIPGTTFWLSNNTGVNWTAYYYAYSPYQYLGYNFTITFPSSWDIWAAIDPTAVNILSQLTVESKTGMKLLHVNSNNAEGKAGWWRIEFNSSNCISQLNIYGNSTPGPNNWIERSHFLAGDYLNVTAIVPSAITGTVAQLYLKFPNGTLWDSQSRQGIVVTGGIVTFTPIQFPYLAGPDYVVGDYTVFVSWNNTISGSPCNATGFLSTTLSLQHPSKVIPDTPIFENLVQNDMIDIYVSFLDEQSDIAITGGFLWFTNMTGENQTMNMINPGYYYAETKVTPFDIAGEVILTIHGNHTLYTESVANISLRYSILSSLVTNNTNLNVIWGDEFIFEVNFTELVTYQGIPTAIIDTDWDVGFWTSQYKGNGNYTIIGDSTSRTANRLYTLLVSVEAAGFIGKTMAFSVFVVPREAVLSSVLINGVNVTLNKIIDLAVTSPLNFTVKWWDLGNLSLVPSANIQVVGIGGTPYTLINVGNEYQCFIPGTILNQSSHTYFITIAASRANFKDSTMALEIQVHKILLGYRTADNTNSYSIDVNTPFTLGIYVDNLDFDGTIKGATVEFSGSDGSSGVLTDPEGKGYYSKLLGNLPEGTWEFTIRVRIGPNYANYEYKEYTITVNVAPVEGIPTWVLYLTIGALAGVIVGIFSYIFYFRFPPSVRQARALKRSVKRGRTRPVVVKAIDTLLAEDYLNQSQGLLPTTTQTALRNRYLKEQKVPKASRDVSSLSPQSSAAKKDTNAGGEPQ